MSYEALQIIWFILVGVLLTGYAILDGFDLGAGVWHLFAKNDTDRRVVLNAIGPVWDGNEVWLLTGGGALFAAFPDVYATVFSGFYMAFMLVLLGLIVRAVSIEFRSKEQSPKWRQFWDRSFAVSSILLPVLMGVALGNVAMGIPLDAQRDYTGGFFFLLMRPFPIILGLTTLSLFAMHGASYLVLKTDGELQEQARGWMKKAMFAFITMFVVLSIATFIWVPQLVAALTASPWLLVLPVIAILLILNIPREFTKGTNLRAFLNSTGSIVALLALFGFGMFPNLVPAIGSDGVFNPDLSLTIANTASSEKSLTVMLIIAIIGVPFVLAYTAGIYWVFRGKVDRAHLHY